MKKLSAEEKAKACNESLLGTKEQYNVYSSFGLTQFLKVLKKLVLT